MRSDEKLRRIPALMRTEDQLVSYLSHALAAVPNPLERLVYFSALRDAQTGRYLHEGWQTCSSPEEVHATLHEAHRNAFDWVLSLPLVTISRELRRHLESIGWSEERQAVQYWLENEPFRELIPDGCSAIARKFFISQLRFGLEALARAPHWQPLGDQASWPHSRLDQPPQPHSVN